MENKNSLGISLALGAGVGFALANSTASLAFTGGSDPLSLSATRFILPIIILAAMLKISGVGFALPGRERMIALGLGTVTALYTIALLEAIRVLPLGIAILIFYLFPIFTSAIMAVLGWSPLTRPIVIGAGVAFAGLILALGVKLGEYDSLGMVFGALAALGLGFVSAVSGRIFGGRDWRPVTFNLALGAMAAITVISIVSGDFQVPQTSSGWIGFVSSNVFYAVAMIGYYLAMSYIGAPRTSLFSYIEPIIAIALAFVLLGQSLSGLQLLGAGIVILALGYAGFAKAKVS